MYTLRLSLSPRFGLSTTVYTPSFRLNTQGSVSDKLADDLYQSLMHPDSKDLMCISNTLAAQRQALQPDTAHKKSKDRVQRLVDYSKLEADGIVRTDTLELSPQELLQQQYRQKAWKQPIADVVVVGGGPLGLSSALHTSQFGLKTVVFEGGYVAQSFSDALMQPVHVLRTEADLNTLAQLEDLNNFTQSAPQLFDYALTSSLPLASLRQNAIEARQNLTQRTGQTFKVNPPGADMLEEAWVPMARAEYFKHLLDVATDIHAHPNGVITEQAPVNKIIKVDADYLKKHQVELAARLKALLPSDQQHWVDTLHPQFNQILQHQADPLYLVQTTSGHLQLAKNIILAQGFLGQSGQHGLNPNVLKAYQKACPKTVLTLWGHQALAQQNKAFLGYLQKLAQHRKAPQTLIMPPTIMGNPDIKRAIRLLPAGTRCAVVGSGVSAAQSLLELINLNPKLKVDLFVKYAPTAQAYQLPFGHIVNARDAIFNRKLAAQFYQELSESHGVPLSAPAMETLNRLVQNKQVRIINLGKRFEDNSVVLKNETQNGHTVTKIYRTYNTLFTVLFKGLYALLSGPLASIRDKLFKPISRIDGLIVSAAGYDRTQLQNTPLAQQMLDQGLLQKVLPGFGQKEADTSLALDPLNNLTSASDHNIYPLGTREATASADIAIAGSIQRAFRSVQHILDKNNHLESLCFNQDARLLQNICLEKTLRHVLDTTPINQTSAFFDKLKTLTNQYSEAPKACVYGYIKRNRQGQVIASQHNLQAFAPHSLKDVENAIIRHYDAQISDKVIHPNIAPPLQAMYYSAIQKNAPNGDQLFVYLASRYRPVRYPISS